MTPHLLAEGLRITITPSTMALAEGFPLGPKMFCQLSMSMVSGRLLTGMNRSALPPKGRQLYAV